jgi:hypothetical protein
MARPDPMLERIEAFNRGRGGVVVLIGCMTHEYCRAVALNRRLTASCYMTLPVDNLAEGGGPRSGRRVGDE